jgi:hypothetical protein
MSLASSTSSTNRARRTGHRRLAALATSASLGLGFGAALLVAGPAVAAPAAAAPAGLSISLSDGLTQTRSGSELTYTASIANTGTTAVKGTLQLSPPSYASYQNTAGAKLSKQLASWSVSIPAGKSVSKKVIVKLGPIPRGQLEVTTLASFYIGKVTGPPTVRTADADHIAGVSDTPRTVKPKNAPTTSLATNAANAAPAAPAGKSGSGLAGWAIALIVIAGLVVVAAVGVGLVWLRRHRRRPGPGVPADGGTGPDDVDELAAAGRDRSS